MSFPRAKLHRFNDVQTIAPSPADYNPQTNVKNGGILSKTERFTDLKSPSGSDAGSHKTVMSSPCFRTPLPKKKKFFSLSSRKMKSVDLLTAPVDECEDLKDKIVECKNKDMFIKELSDHLEELKLKIFSLTQQKSELEGEKSKFEEIVQDLKEEHKIVLQNVYLHHDQEINEIRKQLEKYEKDYTVAQLEYQRSIEELRNASENTSQIILTSVDQTLPKALRKLESLEKKIAIFTKHIAELTVKNNATIHELKNKHTQEINDYEYSMLETVSKLQASLDREHRLNEKKIREFQVLQNFVINKMKIKFDEEKQDLIQEFENKIKLIEENNKETELLFDMQAQEYIREVEMTWQHKLEAKEAEAEQILKECQAIAEYNIIQCELEKTNVEINMKNKLETAEGEYKKLSEEFENLKTIYQSNRHQTQMSDITQKELDVIRAELKDAVTRNKLYEISITKSYETTIETLNKRLLNSDSDVEKLKDELVHSEQSKLNYQNKCVQLADELRIKSDINVKLESDLESFTTDQQTVMETLKASLLDKIEQYRLKAREESIRYENKLSERERTLKDAMKHLHEQQKLNMQSEALIVQVQKSMEEMEDTQEIHLSQIKLLKKENVCLHDSVDNLECDVANLSSNNKALCTELEHTKKTLREYEREMFDLKNIYKKYVELSGKYDEISHKCYELTQQNSTLHKQICEEDILNKELTTKVNTYELEIARRAELEFELKNLDLKHTGLMGHQNTNQKIKYLIDLKSKYHELLEGSKKKDQVIKMQAKLIDDMKKDCIRKNNLNNSPRKAKLHESNKENVNSPNRTLGNNGRVESPLRDRN